MNPHLACLVSRANLKMFSTSVVRNLRIKYMIVTRRELISTCLASEHGGLHLMHPVLLSNQQTSNQLLF